jgi:hypothetical protein
VPQPLQQLNSKSKRKKRVNPTRFGMLALAAACAAAVFGAGPQPARAIVVPTPAPPPRVEPTATPTGTPRSSVLPLNSSLFFVLDDTISSHSKPGTIARAHLRDPIVLDGITVARAGEQVGIEITQASPAQAGGIDGTVEIYFQSLPLAGNLSLPLSTPTARINPHMTAGQASTQGITDTIGDIFIPGHLIYHMFRKGGDVTLRPGTVIRARTAASIRVAHGAVAIATPPPFETTLDTPHPAFSVAPMYTPPGYHAPTPKPSPSVSPTPTP